MRPVVFLGPSLSVEEAGRILDADYRPPLRAGDFDRFSGGEMVGVIDGLLDRRFRLSVEEAREALRRGVRFFGAASTGALLALELEKSGFVGVGRIFGFLRKYADRAEDLVQVLQTEKDSKALTVPLVSVVLSAVDRWRLSEEATESLIESLVRIPLEERQIRRIGEVLRADLDVDFESADFRIFDYKKEDAGQLLRRLRALSPVGRVKD